MSENAVNTAADTDPEIVGGEIVGVEGSRIRVRLESGRIGYMALPEQPESAGIQIGRRATFNVVADGPAGSPTLAFAESPDSPAPEGPFDRDVIRLHSALANHHPSNAVRPVERVHLGEEQIQDWIGRVERSLGRLRKNRAKRLNEEFYNGS